MVVFLFIQLLFYPPQAASFSFELNVLSFHNWNKFFLHRRRLRYFLRTAVLLN